MSERSLRIRLGLFVVLAVVLLIALVILFGSFPAWFQNTHTYTVRFNDAPGTSTGTPVRRSGIRIGEVKEVRLEDETGEVIVTLSIDKEFSLRKHETPTLIVRPIGGDATIDFLPEEPDDPKQPVDKSPIPPGSELVGEVQATVSSLLSQASEVVPPAQATINEIRKSIKRLEELAPVMDETLQETRDLAKAVREAVPDVRRAINTYREVGEEIRIGIPEVRQTNQDIQDLVKEVKDGVPELRKTNEEIQAFVKASREAIPDLRRTGDQVRELAKTVQDGVPEILATNKEIRDLSKTVRESVPAVLETNEEIKELVKVVREGVPAVLETNEEIKELARAVKETVPDLRKTNDEIQATIKSVRETVPTIRTTIEDIGTTARNWGQLGERLDVLLQTNQPKIVQALDSFNDVLNRVGNILNDDNQRNIAIALRNLRDGSEDLPTIMKNVRTSTDKFPEIADNANILVKDATASLESLKTTFKKAENFMSAIEKVTAPLSLRGSAITKNLDETLANLNATTADVRAMVRAIGEAEGTINRLISDPAVYNKLDQTMLMVMKTIPRLDRILKDFETFADKLARHPEKIGIGGAIRPSNGLKQPPSPPRGLTNTPDGTVIPPSYP